jgi:hypothetical protein
LNREHAYLPRRHCYHGVLSNPPGARCCSCEDMLVLDALRIPQHTPMCVRVVLERGCRHRRTTDDAAADVALAFLKGFV